MVESAGVKTDLIENAPFGFFFARLFITLVRRSTVWSAYSFALYWIGSFEWSL